jgi:hypothetical protein
VRLGSATSTPVNICWPEYLLAEADFGDGEAAFILSCESNRRDFADYSFSPFALVAADGSVRLTLLAGEQLTCDWYNVPGGGEGLTVHVYVCTGDEQSVDACDPAEEPVRFVLTPVDGEGDPISFQTDENGEGHQTGLDGLYTLTQVGQQPCVVESPDVDPDGNLNLSPDRPTVVNVFNCE